jgi:hypothetical protein
MKMTTARAERAKKSQRLTGSLLTAMMEEAAMEMRVTVTRSVAAARVAATAAGAEGVRAEAAARAVVCSGRVAGGANHVNSYESVPLVPSLRADSRTDLPLLRWVGHWEFSRWTRRNTLFSVSSKRRHCRDTSESWHQSNRERGGA